MKTWTIFKQERANCKEKGAQIQILFKENINKKFHWKSNCFTLPQTFPRLNKTLTFFGKTPKRDIFNLHALIIKFTDTTPI